MQLYIFISTFLLVNDFIVKGDRKFVNLISGLNVRYEVFAYQKVREYL